jgi:ketosteroid isomerase-like protein
MKIIPLLMFTFTTGLLLSNALVQAPAPKRAVSTNQTTEDATSEIKRLENELARAVVARDYTALPRLEADSYVYTDSDAVVTTRDEFIREYKAGTSRVTFLQFDDMTVDTYRDAAVVRGILTVEREINGVKISRKSRYTRFYIRFPDGWRAVAGHSSTLKTAEK